MGGPPCAALGRPFSRSTWRRGYLQRALAGGVSAGDANPRPAEPSVMSSDAGEVDTRALTVKEGGPLRNDIFGGMKRETTSSTSVEKDSPGAC